MAKGRRGREARERSGTFGCLQPLLLDAVADLGLGLALGEVALDDGRVALVHLDLLMVVGLEIPQLCQGRDGRFRAVEHLNVRT